MKTKTIIKNGTIFSREITLIRRTYKDNTLTSLQIEMIDDKGWYRVIDSPKIKVIAGSIFIAEEKGTRIVSIDRLPIEEYEFIIRMIEDTKNEI
ncbi:hypothetical protein ACFWDG_10375 [Peribacillus sp. NPDC060186]